MSIVTLRAFEFMNHPTDTAKAPQAPVPPGADACCHSGCVFCVFDLYQEELERYRQELKIWQEHYATPSGGRASADV